MKIRWPVLIVGFLLGIFLILGFTIRVSAAPAAPIDFQLTQPDGSKFTARQWGDEWLNGFETAEGYTILQIESGWWVYAGETADGSLVPEKLGNNYLRVGVDYPFDIPLHLRPTKPASVRTDSLENLGRAQNIGEHPTLVLLAEFDDRVHNYAAYNFSQKIFGNSQSLKDYYLDASFNQLTITPASETYGTANDGVIGWLNLGYNHPDTGSHTNTDNYLIVKNALIAADPYIDYSNFDTNSDGYISINELHIVVVVAGYERAYIPYSSPSIWAHHWYLDAVTPPTLDGKILGDSEHNGGYAQFGEIHNDHEATIGIMAHELGHDITWPDLYDTDKSSEGVGFWSIMGSGNWNFTGTNYHGTSPALPDAWLKYYQGWITPTIVSGNFTGVEIPQAETTGSAFMLRPNPGGVDWDFWQESGSGEYFLIENRQLTGYDAGLPGCGLLIWHIDESVTETNAANANELDPLVKLVEADGLDQLFYGANRGDAGDSFPGSSSNKRFDYYSDPNSRLYSGADSLVEVNNISDCAITMAADLTFSGLSIPTVPALVWAGDGNFYDKVRVSWLPSEDATYYEVYRNTSNTGDGRITLTTSHVASPYDDTSADLNTVYYYWVRACNVIDCSDFSSSDSGYSSLPEPQAPIDVFATDGAYDDKVRVSWEAPAGVTYYEIYRNIIDSHEDQKRLTDDHASGPYYDFTADLDTTYYYWVKACNVSGCSEYSVSDPGYSTAATTVPDAPSDVSASDGAYSDKVRITWPAVIGASGYQIFRNESNDHTDEKSLTEVINARSYDDTWVEQGTTYYYWVIACNSAGCSSYSKHDTGYAASAATIPPVPIGVTSSDGEFTDKVRITWAPSSGATYYKVVRNHLNTTYGSTELTGSQTTTTYDDVSAQQNVAYYYWIAACNASDCSDYSSSDSGWRANSTIINGDFELGQEGWTESSSGGYDLINLDGITPYTAHDGSWLAWLGGYNGATEQISQPLTVSASQPYLDFWYRINSEDVCGNDDSYIIVNGILIAYSDLCASNNTSDWTHAVVDLSTFTGQLVTILVKVETNGSSISSLFIDSVSMVSGDSIPPAAPAGVSASNGSFTDKIMLSWDASANATYYKVLRNTSNVSEGAIEFTSSPSASPYDDFSATPGETYYYWVKACNSSGCSDYSASDSGYRLIPIPGPPIGVFATDGTFTEKVRISWEVSSGATHYEVFRNASDSHTGEAVLVTNHLSSSYDDFEATPGVTYYYWVKACNSTGCSTYSTSDEGWRDEMMINNSIFLPLVLK